MSRFLVFSDLHLHNWALGGTNENGFSTRLLCQEKVCEQISQYATERDIRTILFCGDWFHSTRQLSPEVLMVSDRISWMFHHAGQQLIILQGNHDQKDKRGEITALTHLAHKHRVIITPGLTSLLMPDWGRYLCAVPYMANDDALIRTLRTVPPDAVLMMHQGVSGVPMGSAFVVNEFFRPEFVPGHVMHTFIGHYHAHRTVGVGNMTIPGCPLQLNWSDSGDTKGWLDVVLDDKIKITHVTSRAPMFIKVPFNQIKTLANADGHVIRVTDMKDSSMIGDIRKQLEEQGAAAVEIEMEPLQQSPIPAVERECNIGVVVEDYIRQRDLSQTSATMGRAIVAGEEGPPLDKMT